MSTAASRIAWVVRTVVESLESRRLLAGIGLEQDFGDAPDSYGTTLAVNGARHDVTANIFLGNFIDPEPDGQPSPNADKDDTNGLPDDEDGIVFLDPVVPGTNVRVQVTLGAGNGRLNAFLDFNQNGAFDAGEQIFTNVPLPGASVSVLTFPVPATALPGDTYARFRLNTVGGVGPTGPGGFGEVEDYSVRILGPDIALDFGDAPDTAAGPFFYPTLLAGSSLNPARHAIFTPGPRLGPVIDAEPDGQPTPAASGDDLNGADDEDGVAVGGAPLNTTILTPGALVNIQITNPGAPGVLNAWFDWNQDGDWDDPSEQVALNTPAPTGLSILPVAVPPTIPGNTFVYSRFRINSNGGLSPRGFASEGEVEDYRQRVNPDVQIPLDFGDAPDTATGLFQYPTLLAGISGDPARHSFAPNGPQLGALVDAELDGQPNVTATGDDAVGSDDEDGITVGGVNFETVPLLAGAVTNVEVTNGGAPGVLNAWFDWNQNGQWEAAEQVAFNLPVAPGVNILPLAVPGFLTPGTFVYSRFRISTAAGLAPGGAAADGEVEDYRNVVERQIPVDQDFGDAPDFVGAIFNYPTIFAGLSGNPARHVISPNGPQLGPRIDAEPDGQPNIPASGDDIGLLFGGIDDEDGVSVSGVALENVPLTPGTTVSVEVENTGAPGRLNAWFDWNQDGDWTDPGEQVATNLPLPNGVTVLSILVPAGLPNNANIYSRFRANTVGGLAPGGAAADGEVEDYVSKVVVDLVPPRAVAGSLEFEVRQAVVITFSEPLDPTSVQTTDLAALNTDDGTTPAANSVFISGGGTVVAWVFNTPGTYVTDGDYTFTLAAGSVDDLAGNGLAGPFVLSGPGIFWNAADANRDRAVTIADFAILAANFNLPGTFSQGNFNYAGVVNIADFAILSSKFNTILPAGAPRTPVKPFTDVPIARTETDVLEMETDRRVI